MGMERRKKIGKKIDSRGDFVLCFMINYEHMPTAWGYIELTGERI
jgi:hypothetical protein